MTVLRFQDRCLCVPDEAMRRTLDLAARAAKSNVPVLICGESGTGKELVARFIHEKSARSRRPFVSVNCAAIPEGLLEAELFGHERGAFTGAISGHLGKFERASTGTLLLDEISEMPITLQAKLLRVIQEGEVDRLGGRSPVRIDTRIVATTNRDPGELIGSGRFREDLYYRLNVVRIECAPLRGRPEAIQRLAETLLGEIAAAQGQAVPRLDPDALGRLLRHDWPGNVRELQNALYRAFLLSDGGTIGVDAFSILGRAQKDEVSAKPLTMEEVERRHILDVLSAAKGNRTRAAEWLGISVRTLRNKLKAWGS